MKVTLWAAAMATIAACEGGGGNTANISSGSASGGSTGEGGGQGVGGGFNVGSGGDTGSGGDMTCHSEPQEPIVSPLDIIVLLDRSGSMAGSLWDGSVAALTDFYQNPGGTEISAGMSYFPPPGGAAECQPSSYNPLHDGIVDLTSSSATLVSALQSQTPQGADTPIYSALYGTLVYANDYQDMYPDHVVVVVLASDGDPTACNTSIPDIAGLAATAHAYNGVRTYVVAIQGATVSNLDQIAAAGGTVQAIDITSNIALFTQAMNDIRLQVLACEFIIPEPQNGEFDQTQVNVEYTPGNGDPPETIPQADNLADCGSGPGWYYDNPSAPTKIIFCPGTCDTVQADDMAEVNFLFGCPTELN